MVIETALDFKPHTFNSFVHGSAEHVIYTEFRLPDVAKIHVNPTGVKLGFVNIQELRLGDVRGVLLGYLIDSRVPISLHPRYMIAARKLPDLGKVQHEVECKYILNSLLVFTHTNNLVLFVPNKTASVVASMLETA